MLYVAIPSKVYSVLQYLNLIRVGDVSDRFANRYRYFWKQKWSHADDLFYPNSMEMLVCAMV